MKVRCNQHVAVWLVQGSGGRSRDDEAPKKFTGAISFQVSIEALEVDLQL